MVRSPPTSDCGLSGRLQAEVRRQGTGIRAQESGVRGPASSFQLPASNLDSALSSPTVAGRSRRSGDRCADARIHARSAGAARPLEPLAVEPCLALAARPQRLADLLGGGCLPWARACWRVVRSRLIGGAGRRPGLRGGQPDSLDAVTDRDFTAEFLFWAARPCALSRGWKICLWSSREFGFVTLADAYSTGSSLMPQRRIPTRRNCCGGRRGAWWAG